MIEECATVHGSMPYDFKYRGWDYYDDYACRPPVQYPWWMIKDAINEMLKDG